MKSHLFYSLKILVKNTKSKSFLFKITAAGHSTSEEPVQYTSHIYSRMPDAKKACIDYPVHKPDIKLQP